MTEDWLFVTRWQSIRWTPCRSCVAVWNQHPVLVLAKWKHESPPRSIFWYTWSIYIYILYIYIFFLKGTWIRQNVPVHSEPVSMLGSILCSSLLCQYKQYDGRGDSIGFFSPEHLPRGLDSTGKRTALDTPAWALAEEVRAAGCPNTSNISRSFTTLLAYILQRTHIASTD